MKVNKLTATTREAEVPVPGGETVKVVYRPGALTPRAMAAMMDPATETDDAIKILSEIVASWEIENEDGTPLDPAQLESWEILPLEFIGAMAGVMAKQSQVPNSSGGGSEGSS